MPDFLCPGDLYKPMTMWSGWHRLGSGVTSDRYRYSGQSGIVTAGETFAEPGICIVVSTHPDERFLLLVLSPVHQRLGWTWDNQRDHGVFGKDSAYSYGRVQASPGLV